MRIILLFIGLSCFGLSAQQANLDSLWQTWQDVEIEMEERLDALNSYARYKYAFRNPDSCEILVNKSLNIAKENNLDKQQADAYNIKGVVYYVRGSFLEAIPMYLESIKISEEIGDSLGVSISLGNLAVMYRFIGEIDKSLAANYRSLMIEKIRGDSSAIAYILGNIGVLYEQRGDYAKALENSIECARILKEQGNIGEYGAALGNLGGIYFYQGNYQRAMKFFKEAVHYKLKAGMKWQVASEYSNIGGIYQIWNQLDSALVYFNKSLLIEKNVGNKNGIATNLRLIAGLHGKKREFDSALRYYKKAESLLAEAKVKRELAITYKYMSTTYRVMGQFDSALLYLQRAQEISTEFGSPLLIRQVEQKVFDYYVAVQEMDSAEVYARNIMSGVKMAFKINYPILSEEEKQLYAKKFTEDFSRFYDYVYRVGSVDSQDLEDCFNYALYNKELSLKSTSAMRFSILESDDSVLISNYNEWISLKKVIAENYARGEPTHALDSVATVLEKKLIKKSRVFENQFDFDGIKWTSIQHQLAKDEVAIEFVNFQHMDYKEDTMSKMMYAAVMLPKNGSPSFIPLFEEGKLEKIIGGFPGNNLSYIEQVYGTKENSKNQLFDLIWEPLEENLKGVKKVYVSPVGLLHKISFAALVKEQDVYLCDLYDIEMKSSTGKIVENYEEDVADRSFNKGQTTLFGGVQYNSDSTTSSVGWKFLEGSLNETTAIEKILDKHEHPYKHYSLANASERQFKQTASESNILHIATHGFFYPDPDLTNEDFVDQEETEEPINFRGGRQGVGVNTFVKSRNPLMRSGLAFAGANDVWNSTNVEGEDGVLTAAEVATIDMRNTDLVVLSACETGLGDIKGSEGVYGLQRSFKMAGVKYIIMSLWQVPDKETAEFMTTFYKYLTKTNDIKSSFNQTQKDMRKKYDPYYWAAFVLVE